MLTLAEAKMVERIDSLLAGADFEFQRMVLVSLLTYYCQANTDMLIGKLDGWEVIVVGPDGPFEMRLGLEILHTEFERLPDDGFSSKSLRIFPGYEL